MITIICRFIKKSYFWRLRVRDRGLVNKGMNVHFNNNKELAN